MDTKCEYFLFLCVFKVMEKEKEWFENWFDTSFYHILYDYRNDDEARVFMSNLTNYLELKSGDTVLDLPCGKGRHSLYLNKIGFDTTGADISENSNSIKAFPNPSQATWNIKSSSTINSVQLFDALGRNVISVTPNNVEATLDAQNLPKGLYFATVTTELGSSTIKLIRE